jgi:phytoene dehydrogenase-like protein
VRADELGAVTFREWLDGQRLPSDAAAMVEMLARVSTYSNAPELVSADMVVGQMQMAMSSGVRYLDGGWQVLVDRLVADLRVEHRSVVTVGRDDAGVVVRCADDTMVVGSACVVAVGTPVAAAALLGRAPFDVGPPVEAACLDLGTSVPASPALLLGVDAPLYLSNHCPPARLAPEGRSVVHVARYLAPGDDLSAGDQRSELEEHAARAGLTADRIVESRYQHRMTVVGAVAVARNGGLAGRPGVDASGARGVFLAGDWVGSVGHLLDASLASAESAARCADRAVDSATIVA